jgi:osmoprotectant transport system substrate-binding protein
MRARVLATTLAAIVGMSLAAVPSAAEAHVHGASPQATGPRVVIGAYDFPEGQVMAELYAGVIRAAGRRVSVVSVANREDMGPKLRSGAVQVAPEYLGSLTEYLNVRANGADATPVVSNSLTRTITKARKLASAAGLSILRPARAQNVNAFAVTTAFATANGVSSLSDLARWSQANALRLGGPPECPERRFCQPGLERVYGMRIAEFVSTDAGGPLTRQAIDTGVVDVGVLFSTDGSVAELGFTVLEDDKRLQNVDNLVPVMISSARSPEVVAALNRLSAVLTTEDLVLLNKAVDLDRKSPKRVAAAYLAAKGLD